MQEESKLKHMVTSQIISRGIENSRVIDAMLSVPRHRFVPEESSAHAYEDQPLPIGHHQTISQPYIVAYMTELASPGVPDRALEIGTGSGYQAAILSRIVREVFTIEILEPLFSAATGRFRKLKYDNIRTLHGDGSHGWPDQAPFDIIIATAAPGSRIPDALIEQLAPSGRLIIPVGNAFQNIIRVTRKGDSVIEETLLPVRFVPMTGDAC